MTTERFFCWLGLSLVGMFLCAVAFAATPLSAATTPAAVLVAAAIACGIVVGALSQDGTPRASRVLRSALRKRQLDLEARTADYVLMGLTESAAEDYAESDMRKEAAQTMRALHE
jgi:hypothetical protein